MGDSRALILDSARVHEASAANVALILDRTYWWPLIETTLYRPLTTFSFLFNYAVLGNGANPAGYHAVSLLLHAASVLLLFGAVRRISGHDRAAVATAALWAVHPIGTEAVTNIAGRSDVLAGFGILGTLYCYVRAAGARMRRGMWLLGAAAACAVGVFSKESGIMALALVVAYDLTLRYPSVPIRRCIAGWALVALPVALFLARRADVLSGVTALPWPYVDNPIRDSGFLQGRLTAITVLGRCLLLIVWPARLSADHSFAQVPIVSGTPFEWLAGAAVLTLAAATILAWRIHRPACFALVGAWLTYLPASNLIFAIGTVMAERLFYLPAAGVIAAAVAGALALAARLPNRSRAPAVALVLVSVLVAALSVRTVVRNRDWQTDVTLWSAAVAAAPESFKAHSGLADALYDIGPPHRDLSRIVAEKERSLAILDRAPDPAVVSSAYREAAVYYLELGDSLAGGSADHGGAERLAAYRKAATTMERYLELLPRTPGGPSHADWRDAYAVLSSAYAHLDDAARALDTARRALAAAPFDKATYRVAANALVGGQRLDEAAIVMLTGFMVTGDSELRASAIELYRRGLDPERCAVAEGPRGPVLNPQCGIVRRHLCAASASASGMLRQASRGDLAEQIGMSVAALNCGTERAGAR